MQTLESILLAPETIKLTNVVSEGEKPPRAGCDARAAVQVAEKVVFRVRVVTSAAEAAFKTLQLSQR